MRPRLRHCAPLCLLLAAATAQPPAPAPTPAPDAGALVDQAAAALQKQDLAAAARLLDQAKALNPNQPNLAGDYGILYDARDQTADAIRSYRKELALHPDAVAFYPALVRDQTAAGQRDDAMASLRAWAAAAPANPQPRSALVDLLLDAKNPAAALDTATQAMVALPENHKDPSLQLALGKAQVATGDRTAGVATIAAVLSTATDPIVVNNAAFELANLGEQLPGAEVAQRRALARIGNVSLGWTLDDPPQMRRDKASILIASWDTLGWILYREGRYFEAEDFARAAWIDSEHTDIGEHFGDIESKLGNHDVALKTYTLALATLPAKAPPGADAQRLRDKIDAEKRAGAKLEKFDPAAGLIQLRTIPLGPAAGRQGDFRYLILISRDRIEKAQPDGGKGIPGALELMQKGDVKNFTPVSLEVRLPTTATLRCHANACDLTLEP